MREPTPLGKLIRQIRLDLNLTQKDFGEKLDTSASFISSVEIGKKTLSENKVLTIIDNFELPEATVKKLRAFAVIQASSFTVTVSDKTPWEKRKLAFLFSKKLPTISEETVEKIVELLNLDKGK